MNVRQRVLKFLEYKNISRTKFYRMAHLSNGFLDKEGAMSTANCEKIFEVFPDMNPEWLLTGNGAMVRVKDQQEDTGTNAVEVLVDKLVELTAENALLKRENEVLRTANAGYRDRFSTNKPEENLAAESPRTES
jgi:hypothetical protein